MTTPSIQWDTYYAGDKDFMPVNLIFLDLLLKEIKRIRGDTEIKNIIDLGTGTGDASVKFAQKNYMVQAIDNSAIALDKAKERIENAELTSHVRTLKMDLESIDMGKILHKPADLIFCKLVYAFIENKNKFLESIKHLMSNESVFVLITPVLHKNITYTNLDKPNIAVDNEETIQLLKQHFDSINIFHHNYIDEKQDIVTFICYT